MMRALRDDLLDRHACLDAGAFRHADIEQDDVRQQFGRPVDRGHSVARLADHLDVVLLSQNHLEAAAKEGMVVDNKNPDGVIASSRARGLPRRVRGHPVMMARNAPFGSPIWSSPPPIGTTTSTDLG